MTDLKKLRELCLAASKGPWISRDYLVDSSSGFICECFEDEDPQQSRTDTTFIATFNPQTILNLLDEVEAARAMRDNSHWILKELRERDIMKGEILTEYLDAYDQIRKQNEGGE
mgnify:CR=1 FL=1